jgi:hypothetical protein
MDYHIVEARYIGGHVVWLRFRDGTGGEIDLKSALQGPIFEALRDPVAFQQFQIHPEFHTLVWANGADIAPEFLHDNVRRHNIHMEPTRERARLIWSVRPTAEMR